MFNGLIQELFGVEIHKKRNLRPDNSPCEIDCRGEVTSFDNSEYTVDSIGANVLVIKNSPHLSVQNIFGYDRIELHAAELIINDEIIDANYLTINATVITINRKIESKKIFLRPGAIVKVLNPESDLKNITDESYFTFVVPGNDMNSMYQVPEGLTLLDLSKPKVDTSNVKEVLCELLRHIFPTGHNFNEMDEEVIKLLEDTFIKEGKISKEEVMENLGKYFKRTEAEKIVVSTHGKTSEEILHELNEKRAQKYKETSNDTQDASDDNTTPIVTTQKSTLIVIDEEEMPGSPKSSNKTSAKNIHKPKKNHGNVVLTEE